MTKNVRTTQPETLEQYSSTPAAADLCTNSIHASFAAWEFWSIEQKLLETQAITFVIDFAAYFEA